MGLRRVVDEVTPLARLWQTGVPSVRKRIRDAFRRAAQLLALESRKRAPTKSGALEKAHAVRTKETSEGVQAEIVVLPGKLNSRSPGGFLDFIHDGKYSLGRRSQQKQSSQSEEVGPEFMDRALEEHEDDILNEIEDIFFRGVAGE